MNAHHVDLIANLIWIKNATKKCLFEKCIGISSVEVLLIERNEELAIIIPSLANSMPIVNREFIIANSSSFD